MSSVSTNGASGIEVKKVGVKTVFPASSRQEVRWEHLGHGKYGRVTPEKKNATVFDTRFHVLTEPLRLNPKMAG